MSDDEHVSRKEKTKTQNSIFVNKQAEDEEKYNYLMTKNQRSPGPIYDSINEEAIALLRKSPEHSFGKANRSNFYEKVDSPGPKYDQNNVQVSSMHQKPPTVSIALAQRQTAGTMPGQFSNTVGYHDCNYEKLSNKPQSPQRRFGKASRLESFVSKTPGAKLHKFDMTSDHRSSPVCSFSRSPRGDLNSGSSGGSAESGGNRGKGRGGGGSGGANQEREYDGGTGDGKARSNSARHLRKSNKYGFSDVNYGLVFHKNPQVSFAHADRLPPIFADSPGPAAHPNSYYPHKPSSSNGTWAREARLGAAWLL